MRRDGRLADPFTHPAFVGQVAPHQGGRLVRVTGPGFCAGAVFARAGVGGEWRCIAAAPILSWWLWTPIENIKRFMHGPARRRGWSWEWLPQRGG
jgi:hypothetical protein